MSKKASIKGKRHADTPSPGPERKIVLALGIFLVLAGIAGVFIGNSEDDWSVSDDGILSYRPDKPEYQISELTSPGENEGIIIRQVSFKSREEQISGIIRIPISEDDVPGVVILPGAGVSKDDQTAVPEFLAEMGYASITIDQRNLGAVNPGMDLELFREGKEPVEHMMVHDALMAAAVLKEQKEISDNIAMLGMSNGGRLAIIAAAIDPEIKGVIAISTAGYGTDTIPEGSFEEDNDRIFYRSIDPDNYLTMIPPRRIAMFHAVNDSIVPYELAQQSFEKAQDPKVFHSTEGSIHGYSPIMNKELEEEVERIFQ